MDDDTKNGIAAFLVILMIGGGISGMVFWIGGYENLDANDYGLLQNNITKDIDHAPRKGGGLQWVGIFYDFIRFPATWQSIEFIPGDTGDDIPINTQTKDGLAITFDASFQYKLRIETLLNIYGNYTTDYNKYIVQLARGALRNTAGKYSATQFLQTRENVSKSMETELFTTLKPIDIDVEAFQLRAITLPTSFMSATEDVEVAKLKQQIATYEYQAAVIAAQSSILNAEVAANVSLIQAYAAANVTMIQAQAQATALNISMSMQTATIHDLMNATGMNASQAIAFLYVQALQNLPPGTTLVIGDFVSLLLGMH